MTYTVDTNVLVRAAVQDEPAQSLTAARLLQEADLFVVSLPCLCEFVWVLRSVYRLTAEEIAKAVKTIYSLSNAKMNRPAVVAGLSTLEAGGDFADGVIAHAGAELGGEVFVSFDRKAVKLLQASAVTARLLT